MKIVYLILSLSIVFFSGCTTLTIDEHRANEQQIKINKDESVVVLGRRHSSEYETEPKLIECVGNVLSRGSDGLNVVPEDEFLDAMYPWFEPRTAPLKVKDLSRFLDDSAIEEVMKRLNVTYIIWIDGKTEVTDSSGSIGCTISVGAAGCFGFGTWDKESDYEAIVWDYRNRRREGQLSADASGTSYVPAVVIPIPIIAQVRKSACNGMGEQLKGFFAAQDSTP
ncbi:hypothetical protein [Sessilibacter sp. MAH2]